MKILGDLINPTAKQREFFRVMLEKKKTLYGGAAGGGKSYSLRWALIYLLIRWAKEGHQNVRTGLFCEDYPSLKERHISKLGIEFPEWLGRYRVTDREFVLRPEYGSGVLAFRNLDNPSKYLSSEFAAVAIDELTMNPTQEVFDYLTMRLRWKGIPDDQTKLIAGTNPGGPGHGWVKHLWLDAPGEDFGFVQALAQDNPHLAAGYYESLLKLPEAMRKAYAEGNWNVFAGQVFTEFSVDTHVVDSFEPPRHWPRWYSMDWGYRKPYSIHGYAMDGEGRVHVYRELYGWGGAPDVGTKEDAAEVAARMVGMERAPIYADPAMWIKGGHEGDSLAETFERQGLVMIKAENDRIAGKMQVHTRLRSQSLLIHGCCSHLIRTLPNLVYDKVRVEDVDTTQEDHGYDDLRYGLMVHRVPSASLADQVLDYRESEPEVKGSWMSR